MNSNQFERWLRRQGIEVTNLKGTGHKRLTNPANGRTSTLPVHGGAKQLKAGLIRKIKKQLGLD